MSDTRKAVLLTVIYSLTVFVALGLKDAKYSMVITMFATAAFFMVLYVSWRMEQQEKRLKRYIDHVGEQIRKESGNGSRKNIRE